MLAGTLPGRCAAESPAASTRKPTQHESSICGEPRQYHVQHHAGGFAILLEIAGLDRLVYELWGLIEDEVKIVEGKRFIMVL